MVSRLVAVALCIAATSEAVQVDKGEARTSKGVPRRTRDIEESSHGAGLPVHEVSEPVLSTVINLKGSDEKTLRAQLESDGLRLKVGESVKVVLDQMVGTGY